MRRGPKIGKSTPPVVKRDFSPPIAQRPLKTHSSIERDQDFLEISNCAFLHNHALIIRKEFLKEKQNTDAQRTQLRFIKQFLDHHEKLEDSSIKSANDITSFLCAHFIFYCKDYASRAARVRFFWRLLRAIGVPSDIIPPNPYIDGRPPARDAIDERDARHAVKLAKEDARAILHRHRIAEAMRSVGRDPRRAHGGAPGDWDKLENRLWVCREVLGLRVQTEADLVAAGNRGVIRLMEGKPGAITIDPAEGAKLGYHLLSHMRFYHPTFEDLVPFVVLLMIRSMVNFQCVADLQASSQWSKPYPYSINDSEAGKAWVTVVLPKLRGAQASEVANIPRAVSFPSLVTPWSHPYQILKSVQSITAPLRLEVNRRIKELSRKEYRTAKENKELERLQFIQDDMFIYRTNDGITSIKYVTREGSRFQNLPSILSRYGIKGGIRALRDVGLQFGFKASGHNLLVLHMLARHSSRATAAAYAHRQEFLRKSEELFVKIFDASIALVRAAKYSLANLKKVLRDSGLEDWQIENVLDPTNQSRYGNRCASPRSAPPQYSGGTPPGDLCRKQDCIDGCPLARFLPDALPFLVRRWDELRTNLSSVGLAAQFENILSQRLRNIERILARYPAAAVTKEKRLLAHQSQASR
ncbi:hypothetical protein NCHU2750_20850 [Neorhizobium sp. NCHU2750]|nr:hypothetical protein NCHU2750_20850 [Neorhizobium sp. NCHU2750]